MKIKRYIEAYIPVNVCNMKCSYCYLDNEGRKMVRGLDKSPEFIAKALSNKRLGGGCLINLCAAGETTLMEDFIPLLKELLKEGHAVSIVTNGTIDKVFDDICEFEEELRKRIFIKFSIHYYELIRLKKLDSFFDNIDKMKKVGCSFTVELTPDDKYEEVKDEIMSLCQQRLGALCHVTVPRNDTLWERPVLSKYSIDELAKVWEPFKSELLEFKQTIWGVKRNEFCYAGDWFFTLDLLSGYIYQCYESKTPIDNIYDNVKRPIKFRAVGHNCPSSHCYNGHAFVPLGVIPELDAPTYADLRNRKCKDGGEWLTDEMKEILGSRLKESNKEYTSLKKRIVRWKNEKNK